MDSGTGAGTDTQEWPDRRLHVLVPVWILIVLSTMFLVWRVVYGFTRSRRFMISDYLLIIATVSDWSTSPLTHAHDKADC
jgi:hypothetical protein